MVKPAQYERVFYFKPMYRTTLILITLMTLLVRCGDADINSKDQALMNNIEGSYTSGAETDSSVYYETWIKVNDTTFNSVGFAMKKADTLFREEVVIYFGSVTKQYIPSVNNQNGGQPVIFTITEVTDTSFIAINPEHDFPQLISYSIKDKDSLIAFIEGKNSKNELHREYFRMRRK